MASRVTDWGEFRPSVKFLVTTEPDQYLDLMKLKLFMMAPDDPSWEEITDRRDAMIQFREIKYRRTYSDITLVTDNEKYYKQGYILTQQFADEDGVALLEPGIKVLLKCTTEFSGHSGSGTKREEVLRTIKTVENVDPSQPDMSGFVKSQKKITFEEEGPWPFVEGRVNGLLLSPNIGSGDYTVEIEDTNNALFPLAGDYKFKVVHFDAGLDAVSPTFHIAPPTDKDANMDKLKEDIEAMLLKHDKSGAGSNIKGDKSRIIL